MAGVCITSVGGGPGCNHRRLTYSVDGGPVRTLHITDAELDELEIDEEKERLLVLWSLKLLKTRSGLLVADTAGRVLVGEEATNVKAFSLFGPGLAVTKTNIGVSYVPILPGFDGEPTLVEFTGCTQLRLLVSVNQVGTGLLQVRLVRNSDNAVIYETPAASGAGEKRLDSGWQSFTNAVGETLVRVQAKSSVAADDPSFRGAVVLVK